jgi:hypothetical protein
VAAVFQLANHVVWKCSSLLAEPDVQALVLFWGNSALALPELAVMVETANAIKFLLRNLARQIEQETEAASLVMGSPPPQLPLPLQLHGMVLIDSLLRGESDVLFSFWVFFCIFFYHLTSSGLRY